MFLKRRTESAQEWNIALLRLSLSAANFPYGSFSHHSVRCWHVACSTQCICIHAQISTIRLYQYQEQLANSTLMQDGSSRLASNGTGAFSQHCHNVLKFFISLAETGQRVKELSPFIPMYVHLRLLLWCIDSWLAESITGSARCSSNVPQTLICTTPLGLYAQPLCQICQSETRIAVIIWWINSCGKRLRSTHTPRYDFAFCIETFVTSL